MATGAGREIELKFRLAGAAEAEALLAAIAGRAGAPRRQVNHFFDTAAGDLDRARHTLRLRDQEGGGRERVLTAKGPERKSADGILSEKAEAELEVGRAQADRMLEGALSPLEVLEAALGAEHGLLAEMRRLVAARPLVRVGAFENVRTQVAASMDVGGRSVPVTFELDRTVFPGGRVDHEVEIELQAELGGEHGPDRVRAAAEAVRAVLLRAGIEPRSAPSKAQRFFESLREP
jgi:uncharacterized protein YjbK